MSLGNGLWLLFSLVPWYIEGVIYCFGAGFNGYDPVWLPLFSISSALSFGLSVWLSVKNRSRKLVWVLPPLMLAFVLVFVSGIFRGKVPDPSLIQFVATIAEIGLLALLIRKLKPNWFTGTSLAAFCCTFWAFAIFMSSMAFSDSWL